MIFCLYSESLKVDTERLLQSRIISSILIDHHDVERVDFTSIFREIELSHVVDVDCAVRLVDVALVVK